MKASRFGREPIVRPHEYLAVQVLAARQPKRDATDEAEERLRLLRLKEPIHAARIADAFADMAQARKDLREHLDNYLKEGGLSASGPRD
jgi:hypothetical protein